MWRFLECPTVLPWSSTRNIRALGWMTWPQEVQITQMEMSVIHSRFAFSYLWFAEVMKQKFKSGFIENTPVFRSAAQLLLSGSVSFHKQVFLFFCCVVLFCFPCWKSVLCSIPYGSNWESPAPTLHLPSHLSCLIFFSFLPLTKTSLFSQALSIECFSITEAIHYAGFFGLGS